MVTLLLLAALAASPPARVERDLVALYDFEERSGDVVRDRSPGDDKLNLRIGTAKAVRWKEGALVVNASTAIASPGGAKKLAAAVKKSNELSIEAWVKPAHREQKGPARIVSFSSDTSQRNFTLGQDGSKYDVRLRAEGTDDNGIPSLPSPESALTTDLTHVVYTRSAAGEATLYLNSKPVATKKAAGSLAKWSDEFRLVLANEITGDRAWLGELHLVALYSRALKQEEIEQNFAAGANAGAIDYAALLPPAVEREVDFVKDVQPLFRERCFECHAAGNEEGGLNLGLKARALEGGEHGVAFVAGKSADSRLIHLVAGVIEGEAMPPEEAPLTKEQIGILRAWIDQGAKWPDGVDVLNPRTERALAHWAFQPLANVSPPTVKDESWVKTPVDRFIRAAHEKHRLQPSPPAVPRTLLRRAAFDLTGLPPTPQELNEFTAAKDPEAAYAALVDKLLASPHYGERWGRHWLDVARYADSSGQEGDQDRPHAYRYRDFVIKAFNDDMPLDQFLRWQIAGDEYEPHNPAAAIATGFLVAGPHTVLEDTFLEEERLRNRYNELDDMVGTIGTGMLGLTIGCARCHDHKYDAISAREYYRLLAALHSGNRADVKLGEKQDQEAFVFRDFGSEPKPTWLFGRGDFYDRDREVSLGFIEILQNGRTAEEYLNAARQAGPPGSTNQRRALAEWITDVEHGAGRLAARVLVNRVWQHHFGEGLVRTPADFGVRSDPPSHPELLDWLARDLIENGWKLKRLQRMILMSAVYRQSGTLNADEAKLDPENKYLWRMRPRRLEAEALRDAMLAVSGKLNDQMYGPAFKPPIAADAKVARNLKTPYPDKVEDGPENHRRSIYMFHKRVIPYPLLAAFDRPDSLQSCSRRDATTVAPQALALLNDPFVRRRAVDFADRLLGEPGDDASLVKRGFERAVGRAPSDTEQAALIDFVAKQTEQRAQRNGKLKPAEARRLAVADYCQALFSLNEFIYVD